MPAFAGMTAVEEAMFNLADLERAHAIVGRAVPPTAAYAWPLLAERLGTAVVVKHENHTPIGAFKVRGGLVYVDRLKRERPGTAGIISATRGNHGQSLAFAAARYSLPLTIYVPHGNSTGKNRAMKAFGANPVPMQWGEVYLAMKQGTIDGLELPAGTVTSDKFHEITKYYSITRHAYPPGLWMMASARYAALPDDLKKVIDESMLTACAQHRQDEVKQEAEAFALMKAKGVQINEVKDIREFQDRAAPVWKFLEGKVGKEFFDKVVAEAKAAAK